MSSLQFGVWYHWKEDNNELEQRFGYGDILKTQWLVCQALVQHPERRVSIRILDDGQEPKSFTPPVEQPMVKLHVEDLFSAVNRFHADVRHAVTSRTYSQLDEARAEFKTWCEGNGLDVDFSERG